MTKKTLKELLEFGIINLDKPSNYTSFSAAEFVKKILGVRKMSHFGTLDPQVTGVLPIALNRACKLTGWFMKKNKTYVGIMKIHKEISEESLKKEMDKFIGKINQLPPVKSRVKREIRERQVYYWKILEFDGEKREVLFETEVEAGTYIRKLISDLGEIIGGAHMIELRRTKAGIFSENDNHFVTLYDLEKIKDNEEELMKIIIPADEALRKIMKTINISVKEKRLTEILTGKPIVKADFGKEIKNKEPKLEDGENIAVFSKEKFIGIYKKVDEGDVIFRAEFVRN